MINQNMIRVTVLDHHNQPISHAEVKISAGKKNISLQFDKVQGAYITREFTPGRYTITASTRDLVKQNRDVFIPPTGMDELFILGKKGMSFFYRGKVKVPIELNNHQFGVVLKSPEEKSAAKLVAGLEKEFRLKPVKAGENYRMNGLYLFEYPGKMSEAAQQKLRNTIQQKKGIQLVAPLLKSDEKNATLLTDEIVARFKGNVEKQEVERIAKRMGLRILRTIPYAGNAWHFKSVHGNGYSILGICEQLVLTGLVEYAEPNVWNTYEVDAIVPNNFLFPEQWDHPIINTPDAWQVVNNRLGAAQQFGSPDIFVAVVDPHGINTAHPHFSGTVSNGQPKLVTAFNFVTMVANNNALAGSHGTNCASAAVGHTSVSSVGGAPDGTVGIAGNCRLMAFRIGGTEADNSDMYIWIAGFNPNSVRVGFPAQLARGADVISGSFGGGAGAPISGIMSDTFDHLTTYGRNGKGVVLTFSVGNYNGHPRFDTLNLRPWAAHQKTFACGASALGNNGVTEVSTGYSGSGAALDFCAPSHDDYVGGSPLHNPPVNYAAFTGTVLNNAAFNDGNAPRNRQVSTTLTAAAAVNASTITVASVAGMVNGQAIFIGNPSINISNSEAKTITNINAGTNTITFAPALFNNKANGTVVLFGNRDYNTNFGGTSYSTPVIAGISALMLSVKNRLTWIEVREILRATAVKIDPNNNDTDLAGGGRWDGRWTDTAGRISTDPAYTGPFFSQFYGFGRVSASAAVTAADNYTFERDILIRDNMADDGTGTSVAPFWTGVDIWVRNANDGVAPANYNTDANANMVHQDPVPNQSNWLSVRFKNRGTLASFPFYVRASIAHFPGMEFIYPNNFIPSVRPNGVIPNPLTPGTYLIGEQLVNPLNAGDEGRVTMEWTQNLIPPQTVVVGGMNVTWHPCILVEATPHDGFVPTGNHVWDDNNLAQKNISINYGGDSATDGSIVVLGEIMKGKMKNLRFEIFPKPRIRQPYFIYFPDQKLNKAFAAYAKKNIPGAMVGKYKKANVVWVNASEKISFELPNKGLTPMIVGLGKNQEIEQDFDLHIVQYTGKQVSGSYGMSFRKSKKR